MADALLDELLGPVAHPPAMRVDAQPLPTASAVSVGSGAYEGASQFDQLSLWQSPLRSADAEILPEKRIIDSRTRDMVRNDAYVAGGATLHKDNIVGAYYLLNAKPATKILWGKEDDKWESEFQEEVETKFTLWAESPDFWMDAQGTKSLTDFVRLAVGLHVTTGEVLASAEWMPNDGRPFRTACQMIDTDRLCAPQMRWSDTNIRGGVERDLRGTPVAYHIRMAHPSDYSNPNAYVWRRVMARKPWGRPQILHIYDQNRADQSRGIAAMVSALQEMKMLKSFRKTELDRAVLAATYAASIESDLPPADIFRAMGSDDGGTDNPVVDYMQTFLAAMQEYVGNSKHTNLNGAKIPVFMPGTKLNIQNPGAASPMGDKFEMSILRLIASVLGVSYEQLSHDYTQTNYSSSRAARGETDKAMAAKKRKVADGTASFVYRLWLEEAVNANQLETLKRRNVPKFYEGLNAEAYCKCEWIGAAGTIIDPLKETQADILALKAGIETKERVFARRSGGDWRGLSKQIARERADDKTQGNPSVYDQQDTQNMQNSLSGNKASVDFTSPDFAAAVEDVIRNMGVAA